ncbi:hypothetical protein [Natronoglomus mannanivorans]|uniref:Uncharacterized protein n=1 Tax=Natronoglomus mannanivorans TaxID=2979990 RepID=A0AAP3E314_9EURY|nr:hypothetical protein [Halobacteria archaeon AArc-xg1-1]
MSETTVSTRPTDNRPLIVRYVGQALREWPPLGSIELVGVAPTATFVGVYMDLIETEYYPFDAVSDALEKADLETEICGLETTTEQNQPRLILRISHDVEIVTASAVGES